MSGPPSQPPRPWVVPARAVLRLAVGKVDALAAFRGTADEFLASLAPLIAFPVAGALLLLGGGRVLPAALIVLLTLVSQLSPPVLSHALARLWGREGGWLRYATAYNWCQWAIAAVMLAVLFILQSAMGAGLSEAAADRVFALLVGGYALWLHWLLARHGLELGRWRAAALVLLVSLGTMLLVLGPLFLQASLVPRTGPVGS